MFRARAMMGPGGVGAGAVGRGFLVYSLINLYRKVAYSTSTSHYRVVEFNTGSLFIAASFPWRTLSM